MNVQTYKFARVMGLSILSLISSCAQGDSPTNTTSESSIHAQQIETIYGFEATKDAISFVVTSTGCTKSEDFTLQVSNSSPDDYTITLQRNKKDRCRAMPKLISIQKPLPVEVAADTGFKLNNSVAIKISEY
ncbi:hypothetical protein [Planctobacterium marinum]|uniref:Lipoprotein n=1 Tax=Planctobacterium marinum TaxID=1631968 RepID=A0AA48HN34_9ALTE|nr:hypothetical protein MACH26_04100 [Planctobacterium marinum]